MKHVVIVGRPNVGKSALLNRLVGRAISIVHDQPGITRDRISATVTRQGHRFEFVDTGGIGLFHEETTPKVIAQEVEMQVDIAAASADIILMVVDGLNGITSLDQDVAAKLHKNGKPAWLVINKLDLPRHEERATDFYRLGITPVFLVSAAHGRGIDSLWQALEAEAAKEAPDETLSVRVVGRYTPLTSRAANPTPRLTVIGRPNVGKSSLVNQLLGAERVIVSEIPGTTRDSVDLAIEARGRKYILTDTAGLRHKRKIKTHVEMYSRHWAEKSIARSDMVLLVLDAKDGPTRHDHEIASLILEHQKPCVLVVNKWDLNEVKKTVTRMATPDKEAFSRQVNRRVTSQSEYTKALLEHMPFLDYAPVLYTSALQGYRIADVWKAVDQVCQARRFRFTTGVLNRVIARAQERVQPPMRQGKRLKIYYVTQKTGANTPTFMAFINRKDLWVESYGRYLVNQLRKENPLVGCPILFELREHEQQTATGKPEHSPKKTR
ncbi:MAG: ribosome biogenesis GTPase Der [Verrucomicrobiae bacterium]|nr:ribosome biogenesis GTPase Der [Verrucomicrobiae bacterium]